MALAKLLHRRRRVLADGRDPRRRRVHGRGLRDRGRRGRDRRSTSRTRSATRPRRSTPRYFARLYELVPGLDGRRALGPLPRRPRARRRQLLRGRAGRRAPGRVRGQRHRRAGRQLLAGGDRDAAADPPRRARPRHRPRHPRAGAHQPHGLAPDRLRGAAQQGGRRPQRLRARVRHPPGRRAEGAHDLRDHGRDRGRPRVELDRARQALRPPRAARTRWSSSASRSRATR